MSRRKALPFTCLTSLSVRVLFLAAISPACFFLPRLPLCRSCFSFIFQPLICGALKNIQFLTAEMFSSKSVWFFCVGLCSNNNNIFVFFFPLFFPPHIYLTLARSHHPATCPSFPPPCAEHQTESISPGEEDEARRAALDLCPSLSVWRLTNELDLL